MYYDGIHFTAEQEKAVKGIVNYEIKKQVMRFQYLLETYWKYYSFQSRFFMDYPHLKDLFEKWVINLSTKCQLGNPETYFCDGTNEAFNLWLFKYLFGFEGDKN